MLSRGSRGQTDRGITATRAAAAAPAGGRLYRSEKRAEGRECGNVGRAVFLAPRIRHGDDASPFLQRACIARPVSLFTR